MAKKTSLAHGHELFLTGRFFCNLALFSMDQQQAGFEFKSAPENAEMAIASHAFFPELSHQNTQKNAHLLLHQRI